MSGAAVPMTPPAEHSQIMMPNLVWAPLAIGIIVVAIALRNICLINFIH